MRKRVLVVVVATLGLIGAGSAYSASPQVTDVEDDAYEGSLGLPNPLLSDPALDITAVEWAKTGRHELTVTMTINGTPEPGVNYYPSARVGDSHEVFWIFRIGVTPHYNVFALDPLTGDRTHVSTTYGSGLQVAGSTLSATFSTHRKRLAETLRDHPVLGPFGALTCFAPGDCSGGRTYDFAQSADDARFSLR